MCAELPPTPCRVPWSALSSSIRTMFGKYVGWLQPCHGPAPSAHSEEFDVVYGSHKPPPGFHEPPHGFHVPGTRPPSYPGGLPDEGGATPEAMTALAQLRAARRSKVFPVAAAVLGLYLLYALLVSTARDVMAIRIVGHLNLGLALALLQCGTTMAACRWYSRYAHTTLDPLVARARAGLGPRGEER